MNTPKLPPLPEPASVYRHPDDEWTIDAYTPEDMNAHYLKGYNDALAAIQAQARVVQQEPVAWFDNSGKLHGRVSEEQLEQLFREGIVQMQSSNGIKE